MQSDNEHYLGRSVIKAELRVSKTHNQRNIAVELGVPAQTLSDQLRREPDVSPLLLSSVLGVLGRQDVEIQTSILLAEIACVPDPIIDDTAEVTLPRDDADGYHIVASALDSGAAPVDVVMTSVLDHYGWSIDGVRPALALVLAASKGRRDAAIESAVLYAYGQVAQERNNTPLAARAYDAALARGGLSAMRQRWTHASQAHLRAEQGDFKTAWSLLNGIRAEREEDATMDVHSREFRKELAYCATLQTLDAIAWQRRWIREPALASELVRDAGVGETAAAAFESAEDHSTRLTNWMHLAGALGAFVHVWSGGAARALDGLLYREAELETLRKHKLAMVRARAHDALGIVQALAASAHAKVGEKAKSAFYADRAARTATADRNAVVHHLLKALPGLVVLVLLLCGAAWRLGALGAPERLPVAGNGLHRPTVPVGLPTPGPDRRKLAGNGLHVPVSLRRAEIFVIVPAAEITGRVLTGNGLHRPTLSEDGGGLG